MQVSSKGGGGGLSFGRGEAPSLTSHHTYAGQGAGIGRPAPTPGSEGEEEETSSLRKNLAARQLPTSGGGAAAMETGTVVAPL